MVKVDFFLGGGEVGFRPLRFFVRHCFRLQPFGCAVLSCDDSSQR